MTLAHWPDTVDDIIGGDQAVILATVTPARGVVLTPVTNFGARDRDGGTVTVNSSVGGWKKLQRIKREPRIALAFHTRDHGYSDRPEYVLVQGTASLSAPLGDYPETLGADSGADGSSTGSEWAPPCASPTDARAAQATTSSAEAPRPVRQSDLPMPMPNSR
ncbi:pyridoxamine 5'-phosphate oxidase family protein [Actinomadura sp. NPDC048032]|uniref:pyridoxamine 5'-phosphate oxidase family protein n=1 Tax=Actinomadura sp. NPDC048032 TaxID=3155747 RepID=UPI0033D55192